jgi:hypothetical protein
LSPLELKKLKLELLKVQSAKFEMSVRVDEALEQIERLKEHMKVQEKHEKELEAKIKAEEDK